MNSTGFLLPLLILGILGPSSVVRAQSAGTFTPTRRMTTPPLLHSATLLDDGRVLIAGGIIDGEGSSVSFTSLASAEVYDPGTGKFTPTGNMTTARVRHTATLLPNGQVLIAGGGPISADGASF